MLGAMGLALVLALFVPLYTDEVGVKFSLSHALVDGMHPGVLIPQCRSAYEPRWPLTSIPGALFHYAAFSWLGLLGLKISGVIVAVGCVLFAAWAATRTTTDRSARIRRVALFVAPMALGVLPLTFVMVRSEALVALGVGAFIAFPLAFESAIAVSVYRRTAVAAAFVLLASVCIYSHVKLLLFTPLMLLSVALTFGVRRFPGWALGTGSLVLFNAAQTYRLAKAVVRCDEVVAIQRTFESMTLNPGLLKTAPGAFISAGLKNLFKHPLDLTEMMSFQVEYSAHWLPSTPGAELHPALAIINAFVRGTLVVTIFAAPLLVLAGFVFVRSRKPLRALALAAMLLACVCLHLFMANLHYNFYNAAFIFPVFATVDALSLWALAGALPASWRARLERGEVVATGAIQAIVLVSVIALFCHLGPPLLETARGGMMIPGQPGSVPVFGYSAERVKIRALADRCGIVGDGASGLVVDDATVFAFDHLREPYHLVYVTDMSMWGYPFPGEKNLALLHDLGSHGLITRCSMFLPTALVSRVQREGEYCCAGPDILR